MRTKIQAMADRLLLLYALHRGNEAGNVDGTFKLMKIPFMAELYSTRDGFNTFNYSFYRWTFGPFTTEIYEDADELFSCGLSTPKEHPQVTNKGEKLLLTASDLFAKHGKLVAYVDKAAQVCAPLGFGALKEKVYQEEVHVEGVGRCTIAAAPRGKNVLSCLPDSYNDFTLDDDWIDTLWGYFNYTDEEMESLTRSSPMVSGIDELVVQ